jgi:ferredoxin
MAYVITDSCIKDSLCVEVCPTDCIHPKQDEPGFEAATQMYVDPEGCIDCGACIPACTSDSILRRRRCAGRQKGLRREERSLLQALILDQGCLFHSTIVGRWMFGEPAPPNAR